jgi:hypothetical protein
MYRYRIRRSSGRQPILRRSCSTSNGYGAESRIDEEYAVTETRWTPKSVASLLAGDQYFNVVFMMIVNQSDIRLFLRYAIKDHAGFGSGIG